MRPPPGRPPGATRPAPRLTTRRTPPGAALVAEQIRLTLGKAHTKLLAAQRKLASSVAAKRATLDGSR